MASGYLQWATRTLSRPPIVAGWEVEDTVVALTAEESPAGASVQMLGGGAVAQRSPGHRYAPLTLKPARYGLSITVAAEDTAFRLRRILAAAEAEPVPIWIEEAIEDVWLIPATPQTTWTLSRSLPYPTVDAAFYPPRAEVVDWPQAFAETPLTFDAAPVGDQFGYDVAAPDRISTGDLSAHFGRALIFRYHALRTWNVEAMSRIVDTPNGLNFEVSLLEHVEQRGYLGPSEALP